MLSFIREVDYEGLQVGAMAKEDQVIEVGCLGLLYGFQDSLKLLQYFIETEFPLLWKLKFLAHTIEDNCLF